MEDWFDRGYDIWVDWGSLKDYAVITLLYDDDVISTFPVPLIGHEDSVNIDNEAVISFNKHFCNMRDDKINKILND